MSVVRSTRLESIRRKEDEADRKKVAAWVAVACAVAAFAFVGAVLLATVRS